MGGAREDGERTTAWPSFSSSSMMEIRERTGGGARRWGEGGSVTEVVLDHTSAGVAAAAELQCPQRLWRAVIGVLGGRVGKCS